MPSPETLQRRWSKQDDREIDAAFHLCLQTREGRRFLWWLLEIGKVGMQPFAGEPHATAFACGELNVGQRFLDRLIHVSPDGYLLMMKEQQNERTERDSQLADARTDPSDGAAEHDSFADAGADA